MKKILSLLLVLAFNFSYNSIGQNLLSEKVYENADAIENASIAKRVKLNVNAKEDGYILKQFINVVALDLSNSKLPIFPLGYKNLTKLEYLNISNTELPLLYMYLKKMPSLKQVVAINVNIHENEFNKVRSKLGVDVVTDINKLPGIFTYETNSDNSNDIKKKIADEQDRETKNPLLLKYQTLLVDDLADVPENEKKYVQKLSLKGDEITKFLLEVHKYEELTYLSFNYYFRDKIKLSDSLVQLKKLKTLDVQAGEITYIPDLSGIKSLKHISFRAELMVYPAYLKNLKSVESLLLMITKIHNLPEFIFELPELHKLTVLFGWFPVENEGLQSITGISKCKNLDSLFIYSGTEFKALPEEIGELNKLLVLSIDLPSGTCLEKLPQSIGNLTKLKDLKIPSRTYPKSFVNLLNLERLDVSMYCKPYDYPKGIENMVNLKFLRVNMPQSPPDFSKLKKLDWVVLNFHDNKNFPVSLYKCSNLRIMRILNCKIPNGKVPEGLSKLPKLREVYFKNCGIKQKPAELENMNIKKSTFN